MARTASEETTMPQLDAQRIDIDLDGLVARYGRKLAQAELEAEIAAQRAARAEQALRQLTARIEELEGDSYVDVDDVLEDLDDPTAQE